MNGIRDFVDLVGNILHVTIYDVFLAVWLIKPRKVFAKNSFFVTMMIRVFVEKHLCVAACPWQNCLEYFVLGNIPEIMENGQGSFSGSFPQFVY